MTVFFFDDNQKLIKSVGTDNTKECVQEKEISANKEDLIKNTLKVSTMYDDKIEFASFMAVEEKKEEYSLYRILQANDPENKLEFIGSEFAYNELDGYIVKEIRPQKEAIASVAKRILEGTEWKIRHVDSGLNTVSGSFYYTSIKESLKTLQTFGCEIEFRCSLNSDGIHEKWINIYKQLGEVTNKRFTFGHKALEIVRTIDRQNLFTSVIGRGKGEEVGETQGGEATYGRRIEFADIVWSKAKGDPLDKPKGQIFLENPELTQLYGIPLENGTMRKRETVVIFEDEEDPQELLKKTYEQLQALSRPLFQFKTTVLEGDSLGNTVTIHHYEKGYHYQTRVFKTSLNRLTGRLECGLGDNIVQSMSKKTATQINNIQKLDQNKTSYYDSTKISKWQSDVIRGASEEGGNVFLMSPSDLGTGTSRAPVCTVWMNGNSIAESNKFLVANNSGIGFIEGKFDLSKFKQAWTIDGILTLGDGMLQIGTEEIGKFLENTKDGLQFYNSNDKIGRIGVAAKPFPISEQIQENAEKSLSIQLDDKGKFIKLQTSPENPSKENERDVVGLYIPNTNSDVVDKDILLMNYSKKNPKSGIAFETKGAFLRMTSANSSNNTADIIMMSADKIELKTKNGFFVDGIRIDKNGGGTGGGTGSLGSREDYAKNMITAEFNVDYEKMYQSYLNFGRIKAWGLANRSSFDELNSIIKSEGVSPVFFWAYESGEGYNSTTSFLNHFYIDGSLSAYQECRRTAAWVKAESQTSGSLAWYDAMYPYYTSPADKQAIGNAYMASTQPGMIARVMLKGTAAATWAMFDPAALSGSVNGVQDYSDPFEHQISAIKSWGGTSTGKYGMPVPNGYTITSWFGDRDDPLNPGNLETHKGMDFADVIGTPIFAVTDGEVVLSLPTSSSGGFGEYIVIKGSDGNYTGYGHMSQRMKSVGDKVTQGMQIGLMGSTGNSTGSHLHFSVGTGIWGPYIDPAPFIGLKRP